MMAALFLSRALLSVSMIAFIAVSFFHTEHKKQFLHFLSNPLLWGMSLLFVVPLVSGFWSEDKQEWADMLRIKLPLLLLPVAFAGPTELSKKQGDWLGYCFIALVTAGTGWSLFHYLADPAAVNESYLRAKTMITPLENDHVRFSWLVSTAILLAGWLFARIRKESKLLSWVLAAVGIWLIIFLHLLAARTGLFSFYIIVAGAAGWLILSKTKGGTALWKYGILLMLLLVILPLIAYKVFPSFHNRVQYLLYDKSFFERSDYLTGSTDAVRVISLKAGWHVMQAQPLTGVGFGDVLTQTKAWYASNYPVIIEADKIYPSSEWLIYGAGAGWPGFLIFSAVVIIPFFSTVKYRLPWILLNTTAAFAFLFDIGLEVQFGVFIYSFVILWGYNWLKEEKV